MIEFLIGLGTGAIFGAYGTWKFARMILLRHLRDEEHQKVESTYESRKNKFL